MGSNWALGNYTNSLSLAVTSGTLDLNGNVHPTFAVLAGNGVIGNSSTGGNALFNFDNATMSSTFDGTIRDALGGGNQQTVLYVGSGTLQLNGANTFTGKTTVDGGTLLLGPGGAFGATPLSVLDGGLFGTALTASGGTFGAGSTLSLANGTTLNLQDGCYKTLAFTGSGAIAVASTASATLRFDLGPAAGQNDELSFGERTEYGRHDQLRFLGPGNDGGQRHLYARYRLRDRIGQRLHPQQHDDDLGGQDPDRLQHRRQYLPDRERRL